jgi:branched-chain amino acid transport system substrate-binding protein
VGALSAAGADTLAVFGYADGGGRGIVQAALDTGAFDQFVFGDGMFGESVIEAIGSELDGRVVGAVPGTDSAGADMFADLTEGTPVDPTGTYAGESYDAAALIALAIQASGDADRAGIAEHVMDVANAPGEAILPGELAKGLQILADGGDIDYEGATGVELIGPGEAAGSYRIYEIQDGAFETIEFR